eukprot:362713-Chlamydomonas_euryale.AAC.23
MDLLWCLRAPPRQPSRQILQAWRRDENKDADQAGPAQSACSLHVHVQNAHAAGVEDAFDSHAACAVYVAMDFGILEKLVFSNVSRKLLLGREEVMLAVLRRSARTKISKGASTRQLHLEPTGLSNQYFGGIDTYVHSNRREGLRTPAIVQV